MNVSMEMEEVGVEPIHLKVETPSYQNSFECQDDVVFGRAKGPLSWWFCALFQFHSSMPLFSSCAWNRVSRLFESMLCFEQESQKGAFDVHAAGCMDWCSESSWVGAMWNRSSLASFIPSTAMFALTQPCAMRLFQQNFSCAWFTGETEGIKCPPQQAFAFFAVQAQNLQCLPCRIERPPQYRPRVFAHLFSGHRRAGDIQSHLEKAGVFAISVDVIFHADYGDLAKPETFSFLREP